MTEDTPLIAVIDDGPSVRRALLRLLRVEGFLAESFSSASEFLKTPIEAPFACLILDIHLGGMSGLDLLDHLKEAGSRVPVVIITAHDDESAEARALHGGASAFLRKPLEAQVLLDAIRQAVAGTPVG
jgi:FixJ family two-component response regulator